MIEQPTLEMHVLLERGPDFLGVCAVSGYAGITKLPDYRAPPP
jgi:hypothetical protein